MSDPLAWMDREAEEIATRGLMRRLRVAESGLIDFSSNDYLGLASHPRVLAAAKDAADRFGFGAGASPLVSGWTEAHEAFASDLAAFEGAEAIALFPTGFAANLGTIAALVARGDAIYLDRLDHASLIDGGKLSGATLRVFSHNDADRLDAILARDRGRFRRSLVAVDGVFSMDGDLAPLDQIAGICERHGAMLLVDEAHGTGVFGPEGRGACAHFGVIDRVPVRVGTLSKALGSLGGFAAGSRRLIGHLVNHSRTMIYSTALPPACVAAAREALRIAHEEPWRREAIFRRAEELRRRLTEAGGSVLPSTGPIVPLLVGEPDRAMMLATALRERGFLVGAIRPPTVPAGTSRLRISLSASRTDGEVAALAGWISTFGA